MLKDYALKLWRNSYSKARAAGAVAVGAAVAAVGSALLGGVVDPQALALVALGAAVAAVSAWLKTEVNRPSQKVA